MSTSAIELPEYGLLKISALKTTLEAMPENGMQYSGLVSQLVTVLNTLARDCETMEIKLNNEHFSDSKSCLDSLVIYLDFSVRAKERLRQEATGQMEPYIGKFQNWWRDYLRIKEMKIERSQRNPTKRDSNSKPFELWGNEFLN